MTFPILFAAFILVPVIEIILLIKIGGAIGGLSTILIVISTAALGAYLVRREGLATLQAVQDEISRGRVPALQMAEGIALLFAGAVLLTPGFMTDAIGFVLLVPSIRRALVTMFAEKSVVNMQGGFSQGAQCPRNQNSSVIEGEYSERD